MCVVFGVLNGRKAFGDEVETNKVRQEGINPKKGKKRTDKELRETKPAVIRWQPQTGVLSRSKDTQSTVKIMVACTKRNKSIGSARR